MILEVAKEKLTFDDVLIKPNFSTIQSRKDVDISTDIMGLKMRLPVFSANMDTITSSYMASEMNTFGGRGVLHRFGTIDQNVVDFTNAPTALVSVGVGDQELKRANALYEVGARYFVIDVAHGASMQVVEQLYYLKKLPNIYVCVGNFASDTSIHSFLRHCEPLWVKPDAFKIGVGPGSACTTRIKTGAGVPQLSAIYECASAAYPIPVIADGGLKTPGDIAKALAAGASAVMVGGMLAGTDETPGTTFSQNGNFYKSYRGSASKESYVDQGKDASWRAVEGDSFSVPCKGPVGYVLQDIEGGLRSSFSYAGARTLKEFQEKVVLVKISSSSKQESGSHFRSSFL